jgi:hypothetical protein
VRKILTSPGAQPLSEGHAAAIFGTPRERLDFYRAEIHYEMGALSGRINSFLTAQSFLVIAYASSMGNTNELWGDVFTFIVPTLLAIFGVVSSFNAYPGIRAAYKTIDHWHFKQAHLLGSEPQMGPEYDDSPLFSDRVDHSVSYKVALVFARRTPWLFAILWLALGGCAIYFGLVY